MKTYLYRHFNADNELLYVGISLSALNRLGQHRDNSHWFDTISRVDIQKFDTKEEALSAETLAIREEKPRHNIKKQGDIKEEEKMQRKTIINAEFSRKDLTSKIVYFNVIYTHQEVARILKISTSAVKLLIHEKKLGSIILPPRKNGMTSHGTPHKPKEVISGWQLITYLETLHEGTF